MATKTFKIGLSDADKAAMAQDVYERVIALTFAEYDSSETYNEGDFVVYNDALYKCLADEVTGAWDSTKWQAATLQDLLDDVEGAVASVNDKASVNGNYPTMTVGAADNLTPYDEDSGVDQEQPFLLQGTGCGNGEQQVDTGALGLLKEKQGHTVVVNQLVGNQYSSGGTFSGVTITTDGAKITLNGTALTNNSGFSLNTSNIANKAGHKLLILCPSNIAISNNQNWNSSNGTYILDCSTNNLEFTIYIHEGDVYDNFSFIPYIIDLTQWFGSNDNIPAHLLSHPEDFFRYYQGSLAYNEGTLVNANGRYLKAIGRNQWDEDAKLGYYINSNTGEENAAQDFFCSKNFIRVVPNATYYIRKGSTNTHRIFFYDKDKNYIGNTPAASLSTQDFVVPANCCYIKFWSEGTTYNHDITISIYYEDESGYYDYYIYEVLTNNDTGVEVLRSAGSVKDSKAPDGTITRRVGSVDLGTLSWMQGGDTHTFFAAIPDAKATANNVNNAISSLYSNKGEASWTQYTTYGDLTFGHEGGTKRFYFANSNYSSISDFAAAMSGVMFYYELAEPTTEQGTPYSENIAIDDFGSMDFGGTNGVPQGASIFYPVDYKAFIDTLHKYTDGTPSNIALKSDLASDKSELQGVDSQLLNAVGGTLRQCLCVKESLDFDNTNVLDMGEVTWVYDAQSGFFFAYNYYLPSDFKKDTTDGNKILCSKYSSAAKTSGQGANNTIYGYNAYFNQYLFIKDANYTDATAFKNAMKGVLLAYEKASE